MKLNALEGISTSLRANGRELQEYDDNTDELYVPSVGRAYVEAPPGGSNFAVHFSADARLESPGPRDCVACEIQLDGKSVIAKVMDINSGGKVTESDIRGATELRRGRYFERPFTFAELATTDDGPIKDMKPEAMAKLGEVKVFCTWMRKGSAPRPIREGSDYKPLVGDSVPEKALKGRAISQSAKLGEGRPVGPQTMIEPEYPYGTKPFATFIFKYRSRRDLEIEGVIARTPSPTPLEDRDADELTAEEARELVRRMRARDDEQVRIKREKRDRSATAGEDEDDEGDGDNGGVAVSFERQQRKRQRASTDSGVDVVDLTDD